MNTFFRKIAVLMILSISCIAAVDAQNLTAAQMNIYFGHPKKATQSTPQGVMVTEFDRDGRILSTTQGNMRIDYDWAEDGKSVTLSMFQGQNIKDSGVIEISEMSPEKLAYNVGGAVDYTVEFKANGAVSKGVMSNPQMAITTEYFYKEGDEYYPYAIEMRMGDQAQKVSVTVDRKDEAGNAVEFTQELMGQKEVTHLDIEYY